MDLNEIFKFFLSASFITGLAGYTVKKFLDKSLDLAIEKYRSTLNHDLETHKSDLVKDTERFRSELSRVATEHQIIYGKLHEKRAKGVEEIHELLFMLEQKLEFVTTLAQGPEWLTNEARENDASEHLKKLTDKLELNKIYLNEKLCTNISSILAMSKDIIAEMRTAKFIEQFNQRQTTRSSERDNSENPIVKWRQLENKVQNELKSARNEIVEMLREIFGVK
ncbi:hypothetical protein ACFSC6_06560 [Rufibacter sediminis]|uniref:Uncharacterized protein n=1 Tax=Rufibacter sediminis TaxID=2762756 RepID=A0ABR6VSJ1_9BACT|nr:hypothetical protein [Rufibacter sediminis]MBC3540168.1 hypothetical protein [Rufibacter sediminis]